MTHTNNKAVFFFFCLSLLTVPINITFIDVVRFSDIFFITSCLLLFLNNPKINSNYIRIFSLFFGILLLSSLTSFFLNSFDNNVSKSIFFYKYSLIFFIPFIVGNLVNNHLRLNKLVTILYIVYTILLVWIYLYFIFRQHGIIEGHSRPSFPFSDYEKPDSHVYSSYLVFFILGYQEYISKILNHSFFKSFPLLILGVVALFLTGSKTGILIILIYYVIIIFRLLLGLKKSHFWMLLTTISFIILIKFLLPEDCQEVFSAKICKDIDTLFLRSTIFNFADTSIENRYKYILEALREIENYFFLIGNGPIGANLKWYDGGISIILSHTGVLGLSTIIIYIIYILIKANNMALIGNSMDLNKIFLLLFFIYLILCLITEHFLITRNLLPVATLLSIIYANIKINFLNSSIHQN